MISFSSCMHSETVQDNGTQLLFNFRLMGNIRHNIHISNVFIDEIIYKDSVTGISIVGTADFSKQSLRRNRGAEAVLKISSRQYFFLSIWKSCVNLYRF